MRYVDELKDEEIQEFQREANVPRRNEREFVKMRVTKNERVTHIDHFQVSLFTNNCRLTIIAFQDTRLLTFEDTTEDYNPGDVAQIQPENYEEVIQMVLDALEIDDEKLDRQFYLEKSDSYVLLPPKHVLTCLFFTFLINVFFLFFQIQQL